MNNNETNTLWRGRTCGECAWRGDAQRSPGVWQTYCRLAAIWPAIAVDLPACPAFVAREQPMPRTCRWHETNEEEYLWTYTTACGHMWEFAEGGLVDNDTRYCPYCGGQIVEQPTEGEENDE